MKDLRLFHPIDKRCPHCDNIFALPAVTHEVVFVVPWCPASSAPKKTKRRTCVTYLTPGPLIPLPCVEQGCIAQAAHDMLSDELDKFLAEKPPTQQNRTRPTQKFSSGTIRNAMSSRSRSPQKKQLAL